MRYLLSFLFTLLLSSLFFLQPITTSKNSSPFTLSSSLSRIELDPNIGYKILRSPEQDVFSMLSEATLHKYWSFDEGKTLDQRLRDLNKLTEVTFIKVHLIGFQSPLTPLVLSSSDLETFVSHLNVEQPNHIIEVLNSFSHESVTTRKYEFEVGTPHNAKELRNQLRSVLDEQRANSKNRGRFDLYEFDSLIKSHFLSSGDVSSYSVYIINLATPEDRLISDDYLWVNFEDEDKKITQKKSSMEPGEIAENMQYVRSFRSSTSDEDSHCGSTIWAGKNERYVWIDVGAGPHSYGPRTSGEGGVTTTSLPYLPRALPPPPPQFKEDLFTRTTSNELINEIPKSFYPSSSLIQQQSLWDDFPKTKFSLDLVSFLKRTTEYLISPSVHRYPVHIWNELTLHLVMFHDHPLGHPEKYDYFNWKDIQKKIGEIPLFQNQHIKYKFTEHSLLDCVACSTIFHHSRRDHTTTYRDRSSSIHSHVHSFIDSDEMHSLLNQFKLLLVPDFEKDSSKKGSLVIPIFLYDFSYTNIMLLDRHHQSVSFSDMIISIQTDAPRMLFDEICGADYMSVDPQDASRATYSSILSTVWSISSTDTRWSTERNGTSKDSLWSISRTPFGPFSKSVDVSFSQKDSASRNTIYFLMDRSTLRIHELLDHFSIYDKQLSEVLSASEHLTFVRRWNFLLYKLDQARHKLATHNYNNSMSYLISLQHDLDALHELVHSAGSKLSSFYVCHKSSPSSSSLFWYLNYFIKLSSIIGSIGTFLYGLQAYRILSVRIPLFGSKSKSN